MAGQRIDDHSFWGGGHSKGSVFPEGAKVKHYSSQEGSGKLSMYEDTSESIKTQQGMGVSKAKSHSQKAHHRY